MNRIPILAAVVAGLAAPASATEWVLVSGGGNDRIWIDTERPRWVGRQVTLWMAVSFDRAEPDGATRIVTLVSIGCRDRTYALRNRVRYDARGNALAAGSRFDRRRAAISPESHVGQAFQYLCFAQSE